MCVKEADELDDIFSAVTCYHIFNSSLRSANSQIDVWRNAIIKIKSWKFLNSLMGFIFPPPRTGCLIAISDGRHVNVSGNGNRLPPAGIFKTVDFSAYKITNEPVA